MSDINYIGVQFGPVGKIYHFAMPEDLTCEVGSFVLVNTARGKQLGKVVATNLDVSENPTEIHLIERLATSKDLMIKDLLKQKEEEALKIASEILKQPHYTGIKAVNAEYSFDSSRLTFYINYESDSNFDLRGFLREASKSFSDCKLEVRQVGPRDVAKAISGLGACGIEKRCCSSFLTDFSSISIKMAKSQDISLTPSEITGICGRLRCCLSYEYEIYEEARKNLPKRKKVVKTPLGEGKVIQVLPLSDSVVVDIANIGPKQITRKELESGVMEHELLSEKVIENDLELEEDVEFVKLQSRSGERQGRSKEKSGRGTKRSSKYSQERKDNQRGETDRNPSTEKITQNKMQATSSQAGEKPKEYKQRGTRRNKPRRRYSKTSKSDSQNKANEGNI